MTGREEAPEKLSSVVVPLAVSFVAVAWMMVVVCRFQLGSKLSWSDILFFPFVCLLMAACLHVLAVKVVHGIQGSEENFAVLTLVLATWIPVVWVPALVVLGMDRSVWVAGLLPLMAILVAGLLHRWSRHDEEGSFAGELQSLFLMPDATTLWQTLLPALLSSMAGQLGLLAVLRRWDWTGGMLIGSAVLLPAWRLRGRRDGTVQRRTGTSIAASFVALLLTAVALVPFLKPGPGQEALERLLQMQRMKAAMGNVHVLAAGAGYPGIILVLPAKPHEAILPAPRTPAMSPGRAKPVEIRFDGQYWYFKEPNERPGRDAKIVPGDPLKARIQSTNRLALLMEAHQPVLPSVKLSCCGAVEVHMVNGDTRAGAIFAEVILRDAESKASPAVSLGSLPFASSMVAKIDPLRQPVRETLSFRIPRGARVRQCTEITVRIKAAKERELAGPQVAVEGFVLVP